jgi:hypothetical protein
VREDQEGGKPGLEDAVWWTAWTISGAAPRQTTPSRPENTTGGEAHEGTCAARVLLGLVACD